MKVRLKKMKKELKRRLSILLAAAMVFITMSTPVLADETELITTDDTILVGEQEGNVLVADQEAELIDDTVDNTGSEVTGFAPDKDGLVLHPKFEVLSLSTNQKAHENDYTYDSTTRTITIKANEENKEKGLMIKAVMEDLSVNIVYEDGARVPLLLSANELAGAAEFGITQSETASSIKPGEGILALGKGELDYEYFNPEGNMTTGTYLIAKEKALKGPEATVPEKGYPGQISVTVTEFPGVSVLGTAILVGDDSNRIFEEGDDLYAVGEGKSAIVFGTGNKALAIRTLTFKNLKLNNSEKIATVSDSDITSDSISGKIENAVAGQIYEVAGFDSEYKTQMLAGPVEAESDGSYTLRGLSENTIYNLALRQVSGNKLLNGIAGDGVLYIPSDWSEHTEPVKTLKSDYEIVNAEGSDLAIEGTGTNKTANIYKVVINGKEKYSQTAVLALKKGSEIISGNVVWASSKPTAVLVNPATGAVSIPDTAKDGDTAVISATKDLKSAQVTITVREEGGSLSVNDLSGNSISSMEMPVESNMQFEIAYPETMGSKITLSEAVIADKDVVKGVTAGKRGSTSTVYTVTAGTTKGSSKITIPAVYEASNGVVCTEELTITVTTKEKMLEFGNGVKKGKDGKYFIYYNTEGAAVLKPYEGAKFWSNNKKTATISANSGVINPIQAGVVQFYTTSGNKAEYERWSEPLYIVDDRPEMELSSRYAVYGKSFEVTALFPGKFYKTTNIVLKSATGNAIQPIAYKDGVLSLNALQQTGLSDNKVELTFEVTCEGDITGETKTVQAKTTVYLTKADGHDGEATPATEAGVVDISADKFKAYQVEPTFNLWDNRAYTTVYFTGGSADPDEVTGDSEFFNYETISGNGYTKVRITLKNEYKQISKVKDIAKKKCNIKFTLKKGKFENKSAKITLKVNASLPKPVLTSTSGTIFADGAGNFNATFKTGDKNGTLDSYDIDAIYVENSDSNIAVKDTDVSTESSDWKISIKNGKEYKKGGLRITSNNWVDGAYVFVKFKIQLAKSNPAIKLGKNSATIGNEIGQYYRTTLTLGSMVLEREDFSVSGTGVGVEGISTYIQDGNFGIFIEGKVAPGRYEYIISTSNDAPVKAKKSGKFLLTVTDKTPKVSYKVNGKLDSIADDTVVYVTPKLTNTNAAGTVELTEATMNKLAKEKLTAVVSDGFIRIIKDEELFDGPVQYLKKGNIVIKDFEIKVGDDTLISNKLTIPVVEGKFTASGTVVDFKGVEAARGTSSIEAVYTYRVYNKNGKVETKKYYTFSGSQLTLDPYNKNKPKVSVDNTGKPGLATVENLSDGKNYNVKLKATIAGTSMKKFDAKFLVKGK